MVQSHSGEATPADAVFGEPSVTEMTPAAVDVSDLTLRYPASGGGVACTALEGVSLRVQTGSVAALLGESGSGKSSLARFLAARGESSSERGARMRVVSGDARVLNTSLAHLSRRKAVQLAQRIGFLEQDGGARLAPDFTVGDLLMLPLAQRSRSFDADAAAERAVNVLTDLQLPEQMLTQLPFQLSKGQRQRVALAQTLMTEPAVLILDEPTLGVDVASRPLILEVIARYLEEQEATAVIVSHDIGLLEQLVDTIFVLQQGALVGSGGINEIFADSEHEYVQRLAGALRSRAYDEAAPDE